MAGSRIEAAMEFLARERCSAILRTSLGSTAGPAIEAAVRGGFKVVEFTLNTPGALDRIADFSARDEAKSGSLLVGAGTVLSVADAQSALAAGARFLVSPVADAEVIRFAAGRDTLMIPGTFTPSEMLAATRAGAPVVKLFPAPPDGPDYVKACLGPLPFLKIFPTSGVTEENAARFLAAGAFAVGFVRALFDPEELAAESFDAIEKRARRMTAAVGAAPRSQRAS